MERLLVLQTILFACGLTAGLPSPKAFWPLDGGDQLTDTSGNGNHGVNGGGAVLVADADGTKAGAYEFTSVGDSYIEFPNNGAYDTKDSIHMLAYVYPQGTFGPIFNFKEDAWGVHMWSGDTSHFVRFTNRDTLAFTDALWEDNVLELNQWYFISASYNHNTGEAKLWILDSEIQSINIGQIELATNYEARMGVRTGDSRYLSARVSCMQVYDRELTPEEILEAESKCKIGTGLPPAVAFWPLDSDEELQDTSGNGNHGVNGGGAVLVADADGTKAGAYEFTSVGDSYIEFPNNGAYDTKDSIHMLAYVYPQGTFGPIFNFKEDAWGVHMWSGDTSHFVRFTNRDTLAFTDALWEDNVLELNQWYFISASYNHNTGEAKLWILDSEIQSINIGQIELATNYEARMGVRTGDSRYLSARVSCMQVYDRELTPEEILEAESKCKIGTGLPAPVAFWPLDSDEELQDTSGNGNHGFNGGGAVLVADANGTKAGAYEFTSVGDSYIEFPNNGAYDTRNSIHMLAYVYPQGTFGPIFNFKEDDWGVHMWSGDTSHFVRFTHRDTLAFTDALWEENVLELNQWYFISASYNHNTGEAKLWILDSEIQSINIGQIELATNYEARMGVRTGDSRYLSARVSCMQVYDRELTPEEILEAESKCKIGTESVNDWPLGQC
ncbi:uncharacterized protein [Ptychodera flava]|uniref:uncharacterized protein n=1 Tax=Ptychodera flava TaxID=63121 RepID=UPI003969CCEA